MRDVPVALVWVVRRPESWREDEATAAGLPPAAQARAWSELAACAESGWDFSSRFLGGELGGEGGGEGCGKAEEEPLRSLRTAAVRRAERRVLTSGGSAPAPRERLAPPRRRCCPSS